MGVYLWTDTPYIPTANTLAYFPLKDDQLDKVGNAIINLTWTQQNGGYYFDCNSSQVVNAKNIPEKVYFTSLWWQRNRRATSNDTISFVTNDWGIRFCWYHTSSSSIWTFGWWNSSSSWVSIAGSRSVPQNTRMHIAWGRKNWVYRVYVNWALVWSWSVSPKVYDYNGVISLYKNYWGAVTLSDVIIEKEMWTDAQVAEYYNMTKWNYWIS